MEDFDARMEMIIEDLGTLYNFYNGDKNRYNKHKHERKLLFQMRESVIFINTDETDINAYALYRDKEDVVFMTMPLYLMLHELFQKFCNDSFRAWWMTHIATLFCVFHEFAHLYSGHCQICNNKKLSMINNNETGLSIIDYHTIEMDADAIAMNRIADKIEEYLYKENDMLIPWNNNADNFLEDCFTGINGFFFILRLLESDGNRNESKNYYKYTHPTSIVRYILSMGAFTNYSELAHKREYEENYFVSLFEKTENHFCDIYDIKHYFFDCERLFDDSIIEIRKRLNDNWQVNVKHKLRPYNRIALPV